MAKSDEQRAKIRAANESKRDISKDLANHDASRGVKKPGTEKISRKQLDDSEFADSFDEIHHSNDRTSAIIACSLVEYFLRNLIAENIKADTVKMMLDERGAPAGSFSSKIIVGRAFGIFDESLAKLLDKIRVVRNEFAHAVLSIDFTHPVIAAHCHSLPLYQSFYDRIGKKDDRNISAERRIFESAIWHICIVLLSKMKDVQSADSVGAI